MQSKHFIVFARDLTDFRKKKCLTPSSWKSGQDTVKGKIIGGQGHCGNDPYTVIPPNPKGEGGAQLRSDAKLGQNYVIKTCPIEL